MTYISIYNHMDELGLAGDLYRVVPALSEDPIRRTLVLSREIHDLVSGPPPEGISMARLGTLRRDLERFVTAPRILVPEEPFRAGTAYMSRLHAAADEVWEIRARDPKPGIRVFGRFAAPDVFVALTWSTRQRLGGPKSVEWKNAIRLCKTRWRQLFLTFPPHSGVRICDYITDGGILLQNTGKDQRENSGRNSRLLPCATSGSIS